MSFTRVENKLFEVLYNDNIDLSEFGFIVLVMKYQNSGGLRASLTYLSKALNVSRSTAIRLRDGLLSKNLLIVDKTGCIPIYNLSAKLVTSLRGDSSDREA